MGDPENQTSNNGPTAQVAVNNTAALPEDSQAPKEIIATKVTGTVKWFNVKSGYGFINRNDTKEDVFVHQTAIIKNNPKKIVRSVGDGETVQFDVVIGEKGNEASNVSGPDGIPVKGSPYAADKRRGGYRRGGRGYYPRGRIPRRPAEEANADTAGGYEAGSNVDSTTNGGRGRGRGGYRYRRPYQRGTMRRATGPPRSDGEEQSQELDDSYDRRGGGRGRPRGRGRGNFRFPMRGGRFRGRGGFRGYYNSNRGGRGMRRGGRGRVDYNGESNA